MRTKLTVTLALLLILATLTACGGTPAATTPTADAPTDGTQPETTEEPTQIPEVSAEVVQSHLYVYRNNINTPYALYVAEILNTGAGAIFVSGVSIDLEDTDGALLASSQTASAKRSVISPGESAYICESLLGMQSDFDLSTIGRATLYFDAAKINPVDLGIEITDISIGDSYSYPNILGRATNTTDEAIDSGVFLAIVVSNADGDIQSIAIGVLDALNPGDKKGFSQTAMYWNPDFDFTNSTAQVIPYTYNFGFGSGAKVSYTETTEVSAPAG